jgi:hypothetical protein
LVRFAFQYRSRENLYRRTSGLHPNWNVGILEYWNHGFWDNGMVGLENQNEYNGIDFLVIVAYFQGRKQKKDV